VSRGLRVETQEQKPTLTIPVLYRYRIFVVTFSIGKETVPGVARRKSGTRKVMTESNADNQTCDNLGLESENSPSS